MIKKIKEKNVFIIVAVFLFFNICLAVMNVGNRVYALNSDVSDSIVENALKVGKYYFHGDISQPSYIEVYDDGTLQWHNFDFEGYLKELNDKYDRENGIVPDEELQSAREKAMNDEIEWMSARHTFTVVQDNKIHHTMIVLEYEPNPEGEIRRGYSYIDECTINTSGGGDLWYKYIEE